MASLDALSLDSDTEFSGFDSDDARPLSKISSKQTVNKAVVGRKNVDKNSQNKNEKRKNVSPGVRPGSNESENPDDKSGKPGKTKRAPLKSVVLKPTQKKDPPKLKEPPPLDFSKLSAEEIDSLREALGLENVCEQQRSTDDNYDNIDIQPLNQRPNIHVSVDSGDLLGDDVELDYEDDDTIQANADFRKGFSDALFEDSSVGTDHADLWELPKLRMPERGPAVSQNLANLVNMACTQPCDTDSIVDKYKLPQNCTNLGAPLVNAEIWKCLDRKARAQDRGMTDIQGLLSASIMPVIKLAEVLKSQIQGNNEAKSLISDALTMIGQAQYQTSVRRRYLIRPNLNKKYSNLCSISTPITSSLFGDDIGKEIKSCDSGVYLGKDSFKYRGRGRPYRIPRRGAYGHTSGNAYDQQYQRYAPYPPRYQPRGHYGRPVGPRGRRLAPSATVTSEQSKN